MQSQKNDLSIAPQNPRACVKKIKVGGRTRTVVTMNNLNASRPRVTLAGMLGAAPKTIHNGRKKNWSFWAGQEMPVEVTGFQRRKNFFSQWEAANFNGGVFCL